MDTYYGSGNNTGLLINDELTTSVGVMAAKIAYYNFSWRFITLLVCASAHEIGLEPFLNNYNRSVVVTEGRSIPVQQSLVTQFVIFADDSSKIENIITLLVKDGHDISGKFVIICTSHLQECDEKHIFQRLAQYFIIDVILLKVSRGSNEPLAYTYRIIMPGKCLNAEPERIDLINNCNDVKCFKTVYPEKLSKLHGCPFIVSTIEQPPFMFLHNDTREPSGIDGDIVSFVATVLNATLVLKTPLDGTSIGHYFNKKWTGSFGDLNNKRAHVSVCSTPLTVNKYGNFQISYPYNSIDFVWVARMPAMKKPWNKLLNPLDFHVRLAILSMFIGIVFVDILRKTRIWGKIRKVFKIGAPKRNLLFYSWMVFLGLPLLKISKKTSLQIIVYAWIWFCFVMRNTYQASLVDSIKRISYLEHFENFNEALQYGFRYGGPMNLREYFRENHNIYENWVTLESKKLMETLERLSNGTSSFVMAAPRESMYHYLSRNNYNKGYGKRQLQIIPDKIINSPIVMYFKKHSPLTKPVNRILQVALESGIVDRVYQRHHAKLERRRRRDQEFEPLTLLHYAGCFSLLIFGIFVSTVCFVVEVICRKLQGK